MNKAGLDYCAEQNRKYNQFRKELQKNNASIPKAVFSRSSIIERVMRLGIEARIYDLTENDLEEVAIASLKEDFLKEWSASC